MANEPEILPPIRSDVQPFSEAAGSVTANPLTKYIDRMRTKNVTERRLLVAEFRGLAKELEGFNGDVESLKKSNLRLRNLDSILEVEQRNILAKLDKDEKTFLGRLHLEDITLMAEILEAELKLEDVQQRLDRKRNPPQRPESRDSTMDSLNDIFNGGGKYTRAVKEKEEELTRRRGGREKLSTEEDDMLRNAYLHAARADQSKG